MFKDARSCGRGTTFSFKVYYLTDLPLITLCKGWVGVKSFLTSEVLFDRYTAVYLQCETSIKSSNYGEGINAGSILFLFHWLPVKVLLFFFVCLSVFCLVAQYHSWNRLY